MNQTIKKAFFSTIPILTGYVFLGIAFGLVLQSHGYGVLWSMAMGIFIYAGSMQFVAVDLLSGSGISLLTVALTTFMVNARHLFYGISMIDRYKGAGAKKPYLIFALTDETYSLVCQPYDGNKKDENLYYFLVSLFDQCYWVTGCILGAVLGEVLPFTIQGIDFALTALFVTVFCDQWFSTEYHFPAITGVVCSFICLLIFGADRFLIPSMLSITVVLSVARLVKNKKTIKAQNSDEESVKKAEDSCE